MKISAPWNSSADVRRIQDALQGYQLLAVGGCVRNTLLGRPITDIDLSTDARPDEVQARLEKAGIKSVPTGIDHGTVTAVLGDPYEITTFRRDVATDGRRAVVAFADNMVEDSLRRDFTVNAMYLDAEGNVFDPQGGLMDISPLRLRFIGDANQRIAEDYLRILRFFRFFAEYANPDDGIDPDGLAACAAGAEGLALISKERIGSEIIKILAAPNAAIALASMVQSGVMRHVLPGADVTTVAILQHLEDGPADPICRLAALGQFDVRTMLRLSKQQQSRYQILRDAALSDELPAVLGYWLGAKVGWGAVLVRSALMQTTPTQSTKSEVQRGADQVFPLAALDLTSDLSGAALGAGLKRAKAYWIENDFTPDRIELKNYVLGN